MISVRIFIGAFALGMAIGILVASLVLVPAKAQGDQTAQLATLQQQVQLLGKALAVLEQQRNDALNAVVNEKANAAMLQARLANAEQSAAAASGLAEKKDTHNEAATP